MVFLGVYDDRHDDKLLHRHMSNVIPTKIVVITLKSLVFSGAMTHQKVYHKVCAVTA